MRICVLSERMVTPFDEGIKNYARHLIACLSQLHDVQALTVFGEHHPNLGIRNVRSNRLFLSPFLWWRVARFRPDLVIYVPTACGTVFSFLRARLLKLYAWGAPTVLIALQRRSYGKVSRRLIPHLQPDLVLTQSEATRTSLAPMISRLLMMDPGIDTNRFRPASPDNKVALRKRYGIDPHCYVVLHVGHLNRGRNIQSLRHLQRSPNYQTVLIASTSTPHDATLVQDLGRAGVRVIDTYVDNIAELYQLADCYVFPVNSGSSSIDLPLSVLEAMACDLPIVTTRFGGLPTLFPEGPGFRYVDGLDQMVDAVSACRFLDRAGTRELVLPYAWTAVMVRMMETIQREVGVGREEERARA